MATRNAPGSNLTEAPSAVFERVRVPIQPKDEWISNASVPTVDGRSRTGWALPIFGIDRESSLKTKLDIRLGGYPTSHEWVDMEKTQLNIKIDSSWRSKLEGLAAEETIQTTHLTNVADLVRRAISEKYSLQSDEPEVITYSTWEDYLAAVEQERASGRICMPSDDASSGSYGMLCFNDDDSNEVFHRWLKFGFNETEIINHNDPETWAKALYGAKKLGYAVLPADYPQRLQIGYTVVETRATHRISLKLVPKANSIIASIDAARAEIGDLGRHAFATTSSVVIPME